MRPVRLALLGGGWIARCRLRQIAASGAAEVVAVIDPDTQACAATRACAPAARLGRDPAELERAGIDGVMISTPNALHAAQATAWLARGVPVFVQKPLGLDAAEVARVLRAGRRADVPVATDLCYRELASARALRAELARGSIGAPHWVEVCFHNAYRPNGAWADVWEQAGGGALIDLGVHLLDLVMWTSGQRAVLHRTRLCRRGRALAGAEVEDFAALELELEGGADVRLAVSWDASTGAEAEIRLRIFGARGVLELANRAGSFFHFDARRCHGTRIETLATDDSDRWQAVPLRRWLRRIQTGQGYCEPPWVAATMSLIDRAYASGRPHAPALTAACSALRTSGAL